MRRTYLPLLACSLIFASCDKDGGQGPQTTPVGPNSTGVTGPATQIGTSTQAGGSGIPTTNAGGGSSGASSPQGGETRTTGPELTSSGVTPSTRGTTSSSTSQRTSTSTSSTSTKGNTSTTTDQSSTSTSTPGGTTTGTPEPKKRIRWTAGHGDIRIDWDDANNNLVAKFVLSPGAVLDGVKIPKGAPDREIEPDDLIIVSTQTTTRLEEQTDPAYDPLCIKPGESAQLLPGVKLPFPPTPFFGFANYMSRNSPVKDRKADFIFKKITGPVPNSHFAVFYLNNAQGGKPEFLASSCDGLDAKDIMKRGWGHDHYSISFTGGLGEYTISSGAKSELKDGSVREISFPLHFKFESK